MAWIKLDDQFADHPKIVAAGPLASWLHVCGLTYCGRYLTDGWIPIGQIRKLADVDEPMKLAEILVDVGLWEESEGGYIVHSPVPIVFVSDQTTQEQRKTREYEAWRHEVLLRDDCTCQECGAKYCMLHAHHIEPWAINISKRFDINNGITLCETCHSALHRGGTLCLG